MYMRNRENITRSLFSQADFEGTSYSTNLSQKPILHKRAKEKKIWIHQFRPYGVNDLYHTTSETHLVQLVDGNRCT